MQDDPMFMDAENPDTIRPIVDAVRFRYGYAGYPNTALGILGMFDIFDDGQLRGIIEDVASVDVSDVPSGRIVTITDAFGMTIAIVDDDAEFPTLTKRRARDVMAEYLLRRCHDHIVTNCREYGCTDAYLSFVTVCIGGRKCSDRMRGCFGSDSDIVQIGKVLKALDVIDRRIDDPRVNIECLRLKRKPRATFALERRTGFRTVFGDIDFSPKVTEEDEASMWRCFSDLRGRNILPEIPDSREIVFKVRNISGAAGRYYPLPKFIVVDDYGTFIHEYAHAYDYAMGLLSSEPEFSDILARYRSAFDAECIAQGVEDNSPAYYKDCEECFARCFEMYVMMHCGPSILLRDLYPKWAYPGDPRLRCDIRLYFNRIIGR